MQDHDLAQTISTGVAVIPARNEAADIGRVVAGTRELGLSVTVVDDFSTDRTAEAAAEAGARVLRLPFHAGSWTAMQTGIRAAVAAGYQWTVTLDGDGQHDPQDIPKLIAFAQARDLAPNVVVASCVARGNRRRKLAWRILRLLSGLKVADLTSGFRLYDRQAMELLADSDCTLLEYQDVGVLLHLHCRGLELVEHEVAMRPRCHGQSRIFSSWRVVGHYLVYSALISLTRRAYGRPTQGTGECTD
ncbi:glycosyltransferase family 2 protein [Wenzhouxiangella sp. C33]|uniref:Glycosyltransferase family 2 protein n=1 Tax=Wenzhouxiangella limi TaxID=2707351 RepID=A0A845V805_9GAMM|nr:glycosyltransferase family 2 protein [Wenzhouxiangella limi]